MAITLHSFRNKRQNANTVSVNNEVPMMEGWLIFFKSKKELRK